SFPVLRCMRLCPTLQVAPVSASTSEVWTLTMLLLGAARQTLTPLQGVRRYGNCTERTISHGYRKRLSYSTIQMRLAEVGCLSLSRSGFHPIIDIGSCCRCGVNSLHRKTKFVAIDIQPDHNVMHLDGCRKADCLAHQTLDARA